MGLRTGYSAAKAGVLGWMDALRCEEVALGTGVKILNVCPGSVRTQISNNALIGDGSKFDSTDPNISAGLMVEYWYRSANRSLFVSCLAARCVHFADCAFLKSYADERACLRVSVFFPLRAWVCGCG
jgi:short-subunit dehydrogenase